MNKLVMDSLNMVFQHYLTEICIRFLLFALQTVNFQNANSR
jgi:hypothetical protein